MGLKATRTGNSTPARVLKLMPIRVACSAQSGHAAIASRQKQNARPGGAE